MRLIDADDLLDRAVYADLDTSTVNDIFDFVTAARAIRCDECQHWHRANTPTKDYGYCWSEKARSQTSDDLWPDPDFGCIYFDRREK